MKILMIGERQRVLRLKCKVWLVALVLAVMVIATSVTHAVTAPGTTQKLLLLSRGAFNPFELRREGGSSIGMELPALGPLSSGGSSSRRPAIRIPYKPPVRSVFKPCL